MAREVFICHANKDRTVAEAICAKLEESGIRCWLAPRDVISGEDWDRAITRALDQSRIMVLIFSASSNESDYCINEVNIAFDNKEEIIPFFIDDTIPSGAMQLYLKRKQWLNAQKPPLEPHLIKLVNEVKGHLEQATAREEAATREKARKEEEARLLREAEERKKSLETARAQKETEEAGKARKSAEKAQKDAEEAVKEKERREAEAAIARKETEEAVKEKERREAEVARARKETEGASKARKAAEKARKEAEVAVKEKELREAEADKARKEAAKARKETEEARKASEAAVKARKEAEEARLALKEQEPRKAGTGWLWTGSFFTIVGLVVPFWFALYSKKIPFSAQWPKNPLSPIYPQWPFMLLISLPFLIPGILFIRHWATSYQHNKPSGVQKSGWWWALPIFLGVVGGIVAWVKNKNANWRQARNMLTTGILLTLLFPGILLSLTKAAPGGTSGNVGTISGHVYQSDGETPIPNLSVYTTNFTTNEKKSGAYTDTNGYYAISGLPEGSYRVGTWSSGSGLSYIDEWYNGVLSQDEAKPVVVSAHANTANVDFSLEPSGTISDKAIATKPAPTNAPVKTTTPPPPNEYFKVDLNPTGFSKTEINGDETFTAQLSGTITCLKDIPFDVSGVAITPQVIARNTMGGEDIMLQCSTNITLNSVPAKAGDMADFKQDLPLQFTPQPETGEYHLVMKMKDARVNIGLWVDVADYFDMSGELSLGIVKFNQSGPTYTYLWGYIRDAITNAPIANAVVNLSYSPTYNGISLRVSTTSDNTGFYKIQFVSDDKTCILAVIATGYFTQWYNNATDQSQATLITFKTGDKLNIDFLLTK